jgi:CelD/BcsL family acetyltransferase involved in cellulose biosynthesis
MSALEGSMPGVEVGSEPLAAAGGVLVRRDPLMEIPAPPEATGEPGLARSGLSFMLHDDLAAIAEAWQAFEREADCTVFQTHGWLSHWQEHIGRERGTIPVIAVGRDGEGRVLCLFQLAVERSGPARKLTWLASDLCDYNAPLLARDFAESAAGCDFAALWRAVVRLVAADQRFRFDYVDLEKMPPRIGGKDNPFLALPVTTHPSGAHVATLAGDWETFYAARRSAATRKTERKQLKQLGAVGEVRFVEVTAPAEIAATMDALFAQKAKSFERMGVDNIFDRPGHLAFYRSVAIDPAMAGIIHVARLEVGGVVAATSLGLRFNGCYYLILSSYRDGELSRYGTGRIHLRELLRTAIERDFAVFDFTVGDESYKREWCDVELRLLDLLAARSLVGAATVSAISTYRRTKRFIKQTPVLWAAYSRVRSFAGAARRRLRR